MKNNSLELVCCPDCKNRLSEQIPACRINGFEKYLCCSKCSVIYPVAGETPVFLKKKDLISYGRRMDFMRAQYANFYDTLTNLMFIPCGGTESARHEVIDRLEIPENALVLETGIGAGDNLSYISERTGNCSFFGIDNQQIMLDKCTRKLRRSGIRAELFLANAEQLPFRDHSFDVVFHLGAINIFRDKEKAIMEMIRVAKAGTKIVIADETEKAGKLYGIFTGKQPEIIPPVGLVPKTMLDIRLETIWKGYGYLIEFRTPGL
ncbi:MAG: methyltransferase domain-containing protein [Bacteroidetes bacterium]|nr:methyltransferase domain-containing protein [Bacteroidota bacterium]